MRHLASFTYPPNLLIANFSSTDQNETKSRFLFVHESVCAQRIHTRTGTGTDRRCHVSAFQRKFVGILCSVKESKQSQQTRRVKNFDKEMNIPANTFTHAQTRTLERKTEEQRASGMTAFYGEQFHFSSGVQSIA